MQRNEIPNLWIVVQVHHGFAADVRAYRSERAARQKQRTWSKEMNLDYDDIGIFKIKPQ